MIMNATDWNTALYGKMSDEQDKFRDWLKSQPPEEILHHTKESRWGFLFLHRLTYSLNVHLGQPQPSAPSLLAHQSTHGSSLTALFWQPEGTKGKAAAYRWRLAHLQADRDSSGNLKINSRLCKKRAEPQKKDSSPLFRSLERALEKRGSDLRVPAASILFPYALFVSFVPALLSVP